MRTGVAGVLVAIVLAAGTSAAVDGAAEAAGGSAGTWVAKAPSGPDRQEVAYTNVADRMYLAGGSTAHERYDAIRDSWEALKPLPESLDHIQSVAIGRRIFYVGGLERWPEPASTQVYVYDTTSDTFTQARGMPVGRARGAGGVAVHDGRIYYAGGLHEGRAVPWFDVYDPVTDAWTALADMPGGQARDHFHAVVLGGRFWVIGGRDTGIDATVRPTYAYDFATARWTAGPRAGEAYQAIPRPRGGFAAAAVDGEIFIIGGEGGGIAHPEVDAYEPATNSWRQMTDMPAGSARHGIQAAVCNGGIYVAAGGTAQGHHPSDLHHAFFPGGTPTRCDGTTQPSDPTQAAPEPGDSGDGTGSSPPDAPAGRDSTPPAIRGLSLSRNAFPARGGNRGTTIAFRLSEAATVQLAFERLRRGRRSGEGCVAPRPGDREGERCVRRVRLSSSLIRMVSRGATRIRFNGSLAGRPLGVGRYRLVVTARDGRGNESRPARVTFSIRPRK